MAGKIVKTKSGKVGKTKDQDQPVFVEATVTDHPYLKTTGTYKIPVYFEDNTKMLCDPAKLKRLGYWD